MRFLVLTGAFLLTGSCLADQSYLGLYLQGKKIGYSSYSDAPSTLNGKSVVRTDSKTIINAGLLGTAVSIEIDSTTWRTKAGSPLKMEFLMSSGGRSQSVDAVFGTKTVGVIVVNSGQKSTKSLTIPGGSIVDDPIALVLNGSVKAGATKSFYVLDPMTISFMKNEVKLVGKASTTVKGRKVTATLVDITDPRATTHVYLASGARLLQIIGPMGIEMYPVSKAVALAPPGKYTPDVDLAYATSIKTDKRIAEPASLAELKLRIFGKGLVKIPTDPYQTATRDGQSWIVDVHPPQLKDGTSSSISDAAAQKPEWLKPSLNMPASSTEFTQLAKGIVGQSGYVDEAAHKIQLWVYRQMTPNAGIGVLRDATEVLKTKEGVCRDYAILTATLLRAAGIPARLVSGIVNWDGTFYYHAWAEAWDGGRWIGVDSTTDQAQISAAHVKLGDGNVEDAFTFTFFDRAKIEVLGSRKG